MRTDPAVLWAQHRAYLLANRRSAVTIGARRHFLFDFWAFLRPKPPLHPSVGVALERYLDRPTRPCGNARGTHLSDATRATYATHGRAFYRWAALEGLTSTDLLLRFVPPPKPAALPRALPDDAVDALFDHLDALGDERTAVIAWLAYSGLRAIEIARLRIEHVYLGAHPRLMVHGKGGRWHPVYLHPHVADMLRRTLIGRPRTGWVLTSRTDPSKPISRKWVSELLSHAMRDAGLAESGHALRHTFATVVLAESHGTKLRAVSRQLGHSSVTVTERVYTNSYDGDAEESVALLRLPGHPRRS